jgi:hypothetical protein
MAPFHGARISQEFREDPASGVEQAERMNADDR